MNRFTVLFVPVLVGLFCLELLEPVQRALIQPFTGMIASVSAALLTLFDPDVVASGRIIRHTTAQFAVSIEAGCNGIEAAIVLVAGIVALPGAIPARLAAILVGFTAIQVLNIARVISLFYLGQWNIDLFTWSHLYLWPVLIMLDVLVIFALYLRWLQGRTVAAGPA